MARGTTLLGRLGAPLVVAAAGSSEPCGRSSGDSEVMASSLPCVPAHYASPRGETPNRDEGAAPLPGRATVGDGAWRGCVEGRGIARAPAPCAAPGPARAARAVHETPCDCVVGPVLGPLSSVTRRFVPRRADSARCPGLLAPPGPARAARACLRCPGLLALLGSCTKRRVIPSSAPFWVLCRAIDGVSCHAGRAQHAWVGPRAGRAKRSDGGAGTCDVCRSFPAQVSTTSPNARR